MLFSWIVGSLMSGRLGELLGTVGRSHAIVVTAGRYPGRTAVVVGRGLLRRTRRGAWRGAYPGEGHDYPVYLEAVRSAVGETRLHVGASIFIPAGHGRLPRIGGRPAVGRETLAPGAGRNIGLRRALDFLSCSRLSSCSSLQKNCRWVGTGCWRGVWAIMTGLFRPQLILCVYLIFPHLTRLSFAPVLGFKGRYFVLALPRLDLSGPR